MSRASCLAATLVSSALVIPLAARASDFTLFPHGGRATAQAGAFTARAADASAVSYNPAAIAHLDSFQLQLGVGLDVPRETYTVGAEQFTTDRHVNFPPAAYVSWRPVRDSRWAFGVGFDSQVLYRQNWPLSLSGPYNTRDFEVEVSQVHPVVAFAIDKRWSIGAGIRYLTGRLRDNYQTPLASGRNPNTYFVIGERLAEPDAAGWAADVSVSFRVAAWGFGAVFSSRARLDATADVSVRVRYAGPAVADPRVETGIIYLLEQAPRGLGIDLPPELRGGAWIAPYAKLRLELDLALAQWSKANWDRPREYPQCGAPCSFRVPRDWRDSLSIRVGAEHEVTDRFQLAGGVAYEPSPVPAGHLEPAIQQGNALVYAIGASYGFPHVSFDLGYSFHDQRDRRDKAGGLRSSSTQIIALSARWRF
jgi:long-chain fatty acid transport protein